LTEEPLSTFSLSGARSFAEKYKAASSEKRLGQSFWRDFFTEVVAIDDLMSAGIEFEYPVRSARGTINFIDVFWPAVLLIEQKSEGKSLEDAEKQARDYLIALAPALRPPTIVVSDFKRIRIVEVLAGNTFEFTLDSLVENLPRLELAIGKLALEATKPELSADQKAVELMADLFVEFEKAGYGGHELSVFLVRILFLNFGDDTRMWKRTTRGLFADFIEATSADGMGVGGRLQELFQVLNTPNDKRPTTLSSTLVDFPYVNGGLFSEQLPVFSFTAEMREALRRTTEYDWSKISPAIFGAMFQTVKSKEERRSLGEHYTSEANILKVIRPLFLDEFTERLQKAWGSASSLRKFHAELATYNYLDPACGSGNFLVVAYKRLRDIELKLMARLQELEGRQGEVFLDGRMGLSITLDQFHGIEINEWSSQIATVAMYLADHQANLEMEEVTGSSPNSFPLSASARVHHGNALTTTWAEVCPINDRTFIMGNPPFLGSLMMTEEQRADTRDIWRNHKKTGLVDFVTNWFIIAGNLAANTGCQAAFVSTNSITQGEQPSLIWGELNPLGIEIFFAHRSFSWTNEAKGKAAVHVVIVGFQRGPVTGPRNLWTYATVKSTPTLIRATQINPYLLDAPKVVVQTRHSALSSFLPPMFFGSMARDEGHLSKISLDEAEEIRAKDPLATKYLRKLIGATELINNTPRFCLWLEDADPSDLRNSPELSQRVSAVRAMRLSSKASSTREAAKTAHLFVQRAQPSSPYIAVPRVSSETREYVPMGFFEPNIIANDALLTVPNASHGVFSVLMSRPFNLWNRTVSGRLKSDTRISQEITYNNFPLPTLTEVQTAKLAREGQAILDARAKFPSSSLADLYGRSSMPEGLLRAHQANDKAVLEIFGLKPSATDEEVLSALFSSYSNMSSGLLEGEKVTVKRARKN
jgi:hypothetical protein